MTTTERNQQAGELLTYLSEELDISDTKYQEAEDRYTAVSDWLSRPQSTVSRFSPTIYVQGSFRLGTVIKPTTDDGEYDIDSVCKLELNNTQYTQEQLKNLIGHEVKGYAKAQSMNKPVVEGKRCWTLNYADGSQFHMDILPAIPNAEQFRAILEREGVASEWTDDAIAITDNTHPNYKVISPAWPVSNPKGYANWFKARMAVASSTAFRDSALLTEMYESIEEVPTYRLKTPLQRVIQLMKRHRDIMYGDSDDKPISIIITTLAAHAYSNETNLIDALANIVDNMLDHIQKRGDIKWITNPVNPLENFADKWPTHRRREKNFYDWHASLQKLVNSMLHGTAGLQNFSTVLDDMAGNSSMSAVMEKYGNSMRSARDTKTLKASAGKATLGAVVGSTIKSHKFYGN